MIECYNPHKYFFRVLLLLCLPVFSFAQTITYSDPLKDDSRDVNFEIVGKMNGNILVFKNAKGNYAVNIYDGDMQLKDKIKFDFMTGKAFNANFIAYPDFFYLIYQYEQKGIMHCMAAKLDANGKLLNEPAELDTTKVDWLDESNIYKTINSDDKQKILVFKIQNKKSFYNFTTLLFDNQLKLLHAGRESLPVDDRKNALSDYFVDNDGNFVFTKASRPSIHEAINHLNLIIKNPLADSFTIRDIYLAGNSLDAIKLKIDNFNKHYIINSFYYNQHSDNMEGIFCNIWDKQADTTYANVFIQLSDSLREIARTTGSKKSAFNDFFIRNIIVKKDGGYLLAAEDYSFTTSSMLNNNIWNRWDYLYGNPYALTPYSYYNPAYNWFYSPYNNPANQNKRFYYENVLLLSIDKNGKQQWGNILNKDQYADNDDNYLSYITFNAGGEIHFLFNETTKRKMLLSDNTVTADGSINKNSPLRSNDNNYEFMPKFGRQVGARQIIIPCTYRNSICFAKIDY